MLRIPCEDKEICLDGYIYVIQSFLKFENNSVIIVKYKSDEIEREQAYIYLDKWKAFNGIKYKIEDNEIFYEYDLLEETDESLLINYYLNGGLYHPLTLLKNNRVGYQLDEGDNTNALNINKFVNKAISLNYPVNKDRTAYDFTYSHPSGYFFTPYPNLKEHNSEWYKNNVYPEIRNSKYKNEKI